MLTFTFKITAANITYFVELCEALVVYNMKPFIITVPDVSFLGCFFMMHVFFYYILYTMYMHRKTFRNNIIYKIIIIYTKITFTV